MRLAVRRVDPSARLPTRSHDTDAGFDLYAFEAGTLAPGERVSVRTGIAVEVPERHAGLVLPRSGLAASDGIALVNSPGLIDAGYRGEIRVLLLNTDGAATFTFEPGDRIAQLVVIRAEAPDVVEVESLAGSERGESGFGSTGA